MGDAVNFFNPLGADALGDAEENLAATGVANDADSLKGRDTAFTWAEWLLNYQNPSA